MADIDNLEIKISADSSRAADNVLALANSLSKLAGKTPIATANLTNLSRAIKSISGITKVGKLTESVEEISSAINKLNSITASDNIKNIADSLSSLSSVSKTLGEFKIGKSLSNSVDILAETIPKLNAIGSVENSVELLDSVGNILQATTDFKQISDNINGLQIGKSFLTNLENLSFIIEYLNSIEDTGKFTDGVSNIAKAIGIFNSIEVNPATASLARIAPVMEDVATALQSASSATVRFENLTTGLAKFAAGLSSISFTNTENIENIVNGLNKFNEIDIDESVTKSMNAIAKAVNSISNAKWNESAADNLRYFIDTLRVLTDEDVYRLENLAEVLSSLKGAKGIDLSMFSDPSKTTAQTTGVEEVVEEYKYSINVAGAFGAVLKGLGHTAAFVANTSFKALGAAVNATNTAFQVGMRGISSAVKGVFSPITAVGKKMKEASEKMGTFLSSIKRIALYRAIRTALKAISEGIKEGRENLYQYSLIAGTQFAKSMDMAATSFLYLKNSIGAATAPLTNYFVPIIDKVVDRIVELINKFNELTAVLTGADTWTKALKYPTQWQEAADDANKSAKKLKSTMLGFDELNVIEPSTSSSKSKLEDALDYSRMFEEVKTDMQSVFDGVDLTLPIKLALDSEGDNTLKSIIKTWEKIRSLVQSVAKSFKTVWMNGTGQRTLELFLQIIQNISDTIGNVAEGIRKAWDEGDKGTEIIQHIWNSANNVLTVVRDIWGSLKDWAGNINWNPLFDTFDELTKTIESITSPESSIMRGFKALFTDALEPIGTILIEEGLPAAFDLLNSSLAALEKLADSIDLEYLVSDLGYIAELTFSNISGLVSGLSAVISIASGVDVAEQDIDNLEKAYKRLVDFFGGEDSDYAFIAQELENKGLFGFGDSLGQYIFDVFNKDKLDGFSWKESFEDMGLDFTGGEEVGFFKDFKSNLETGWNDIVKWVDDNIVRNIEDLFDFPKTVGENVRKWWDDQWEEFKKGLEATKENVSKKLQEVKDDLLDFPKTLWDDVSKKMSESWDDFKKGLKAIFGIKNSGSSQTKELGKDISNGIKNGISEPFNNIGTWIQNNIFDPFVNAFKSLFKIGSPSKVMDEQGEFITDGLLNGIKNKFSISSITEWIRSNLFTPFKNALNNVFGVNKSGESDTGKSIGSSIVSGIKSVFTGTDFSDVGTEITEGIGGGFTATFDENVSGKVSEKRDLLKNYFRKDEFTESGENIVSGIGAGFNDQGNYDRSIGQWVLEKVGWIKGAFAKENFVGAGESIGEGRVASHAARVRGRDV